MEIPKLELCVITQRCSVFYHTSACGTPNVSNPGKMNKNTQKKQKKYSLFISILLMCFSLLPTFAETVYQY